MLISILVLVSAVSAVYATYKTLTFSVDEQENELIQARRILGRAHLLVKQREAIDEMTVGEQRYQALQQWRNDVQNYTKSLEHKNHSANVYVLPFSKHN